MLLEFKDLGLVDKLHSNTVWATLSVQILSVAPSCHVVNRRILRLKMP